MERTQKAALPNTLRKQNYISILNEFRGNESLSANDVSARTGISRATVMKAVNHFIEKGLLASAGKGASTEIGGKKPELFQFCMCRYLLCIGLHGGDMVASVYDLTNRLLMQQTTTFCPDSPVEEFLDNVQNIAEKILEELPRGKELLYGISLFVGGVMESETGVMHYSVITPGWGHNVPLKALLAERFPGIEIIADNLARMSACAAVLDNREYEEKRAAVVYTDLGVSACYIDKGHVLHGPNSMIGEIGPMILSLSESKPYEKGQQSYFSTLISEETLCKKALSQPELLDTSCLKPLKNHMKLRHILDAAENGDLLGRNIVREAAWAFAAALHNIVLNFDPEVVIIQGNYAYAGEWFVQCIREGMSCFPRNSEKMSFELKFDKRPLIDLQMMGATKLLTRRFFSSAEWI